MLVVVCTPLKSVENNDDSLRTLGKCSTSAAAYQTSHLFKGEIIAVSHDVSSD